MNKQEKYINYIVGDLVKKTEIINDRVTYPFDVGTTSGDLAFTNPQYISHFKYVFPKYIIERYGVKDDEIKTIWKQYKERILSLIKK
jgi:hypothetical protein